MLAVGEEPDWGQLVVERGSARQRRRAGNSANPSSSRSSAGSPAETTRVVTVPVRWTEPLPGIVMANAILAHVDEVGDAIVMFGQVTPPPLPPDPSERARILSELKEIVATPLFRFTASPERLRTFITSLEELLTVREKYQAALKEREGTAAGD